MSNSIGTTKKHINGYTYLSIGKFPVDEIKLKISTELIQKANHAQFLLGKLSGITLLLPNVEYFISSYIMKDATASSQIEGTKATLVEAFEYVAHPGDLDTDADDITHYISALNFGLKRLKEDNFPFSLRFIRELHKKLMQDARSSHFSNPGEFRRSQNWIGGTKPESADFVPPPPDEIAEPLADLEKFIHIPFLHPVIDAGLLHAQFETIHPFLDGNGRTGRLLITFYLIHNNCLELPALFLSSYFKRHQSVYYQRLRKYHTGNIESWLAFFVDAVIDAAQEAIEISKKVTKQRDTDLEKIATLTKRSAETAQLVIKNLYKDPIVSSTTIQEWIGQTKPGVIQFIDRLIEVGILELYKKGEGARPSLYVHKQYVNIFSES